MNDHPSDSASRPLGPPPEFEDFPSDPEQERADRATDAWDRASDKVLELETKITAGEAREAALQRDLTEVRAELLEDNLTLRDQKLALGQKVKTAEAAIVSLQAERDQLRTLAQECKLRDLPAARIALSDLQAQLQAITQEMKAEIKRIDAIKPQDYWIPSATAFAWADRLAALGKGQQ